MLYKIDSYEISIDETHCEIKSINTDNRYAGYSYTLVFRVVRALINKITELEKGKNK